MAARSWDEFRFFLRGGSVMCRNCAIREAAIREAARRATALNRQLQKMENLVTYCRDDHWSPLFMKEWNKKLRITEKRIEEAAEKLGLISAYSAIAAGNADLD